MAVLPLLLAFRLSAQEAVTVPATSSAYDRLERIASAAGAQGVFLGERPLSLREMRRMVASLSRAIDAQRQRGQDVDWAKRELDSLATLLNKSVRSDWTLQQEIWNAEAHVARLDSNGLGFIDAASNPFEEGRRGVPVGRGLGFNVAATGFFAVGSHLAMLVEPRFTGVAHAETADGAQLARWYARAVYRNVALQVGREDRVWGQSPWSALFISGNAAAAPAISLQTDTAIALPWLFHYLGPARFSVFLADLGREQRPTHARLAGWQGSVQPFQRLEIGIAVLTQTGGTGGPKGSFLTRLVDLFPLIDALNPQRSDIQISNKLAGGHLRLHLPELSNSDFYYELQLDDFDGRRLRSSFVDDGAHLLGVRLPVSFNRGQLVTRMEWHHSSLRLYEHTQFPSGVTYRDKIIGEPIGPNAVAGHLGFEWHTAARTTALQLSDERRDPSLYASTASPDHDIGFRFIRLTDDPDYHRRRAMLTVTTPAGDGDVRVMLGYNRAWRTGGSARNEWMTGVALGMRSIRTF